MRMFVHRALAITASALTISFTAAAQGGNECTGATAISGNGTFNVNTTGATDSATQTGGCATRHNDVWFAWTASVTQFTQVQTCGGVAVDTVVAAYTGTCGALTPVACNDDSCGLQSTASFNATAGTTYFLQLGAFGAGTTYTGTFTIGAAAPCGTNTGPDVIVGDLTDTLNVNSSGGIDAVAIGTTSCNMGTASIAWVASTPAHPVIRQNVYRYKVENGAGRFQQAGLSWLKHAFGVAPGSLCCACTGGGGGLAVGCSDPYGSGLNGGQSGAGPNWQVNAFNGVFTYPPANPAWSGATARRCQIPTSELEQTGIAGNARYFGECHYVTADDAQAGNGTNNASWREMTVTSGEPTLGLTGVTHRQESAIRVWGQIESGVTTNNVPIPGEGLLIVASKATSLGAGQWHYEYAVYNMNSDRNVGSFSLPIPGSATVANIGFHDVAYHDGDGNGNVNISGTDWAGIVSGGAITWACETQAQNNNANAIRWGSTYNFRFDANVPPQTGTLTLGIWKPGTPSSVTTTGDVPSGNSAFLGYCFGDGSSGACPCANNGAAGNGCANSAFAAGANLSASGNASVAADSVTLNANNLTGSIAIFFQGATSTAATVIDDGLGCVGGPIVRLGSKPVPANSSSYPQGGDPSVSVRGSVPAAGGTFFYQCFYRNAVVAFCPPATSNRTNGVQITWAP